jgi:hypothetical protein
MGIGVPKFCLPPYTYIPILDSEVDSEIVLGNSLRSMASETY